MIRAMFRTAVLLPTILCLLRLGSASSQAAMVTYQFTAGVTEILESGELASDGSITVGTIVTGTFSYDTDAAVVSSGVGSTVYNAGDISLTMGNYQVNVLGPRISINNDHSSNHDQFRIWRWDWDGSDPITLTGTLLRNGSPISAEPIEWHAWAEVLIRLQDTTETVFSSTDLPSTIPALSSFNNLAFDIILLEGNNKLLYTLDLQSLQAVPEPTAFALLALGIPALIMKRR